MVLLQIALFWENCNLGQATRHSESISRAKDVRHWKAKRVGRKRYGEITGLRRCRWAFLTVSLIFSIVNQSSTQINNLKIQMEIQSNNNSEAATEVAKDKLREQILKAEAVLGLKLSDCCDEGLLARCSDLTSLADGGYWDGKPIRNGTTKDNEAAFAQLKFNFFSEFYKELDRLRELLRMKVRNFSYKDKEYDPYSEPQSQWFCVRRSWFTLLLMGHPLMFVQMTKGELSSLKEIAKWPEHSHLRVHLANYIPLPDPAVEKTGDSLHMWVTKTSLREAAKLSRGMRVGKNFLRWFNAELFDSVDRREWHDYIDIELAHWNCESWKPSEGAFTFELFANEADWTVMDFEISSCWKTGRTVIKLCYDRDWLVDEYNI